VLNDGTNAYVYGLGRIAQVNTSTEYFLGDALGSVRQLVDSSGTVTLAKSYTPYGEVRSTAGSGTSPFAYTGEMVDASGLTYLRARYYASGTGRFISRDTWNGNANMPMSFNRWNYGYGNPVNRIDPSGYYSKELISKNMDLMEFSSKPGWGAWKNHSHWGLYALLRNAQDYDLLRIGYVDLMRRYPDISWSNSEMIWSVNCETIMIGFKTLRQYYDSEILRQNHPGIWWRDTTSMYYELVSDYNYVTGQPLPGRGFVDGDSQSSFPLYHSISIGVFYSGVSVEFNIVADVDGNKYLGISFSPWGATVGVGYTESYLCSWRSTCSANLSQSEVESAIAGFCAGPEAMFFAGVNLSVICHGFAWDGSFSSVTTFYSGLEFGGTPFGGGVLIPLSWFGVAPNPRLGWRWAQINQMNGWTLDDILAAGG
jgi:RHS repeat-associated protein